MDKRELILREIKRVARSIAPEPLTQAIFKKESKIPFSKLRYYFDTFNKAVEAAGLEPNQPDIPIKGYKTLSEDELLKEIGELWKRVGRRPTESLMNSIGKFSTRPYRKRWGKFSNAIDYYISKFGEPITKEDYNKIRKQYVKIKPVIIPKTIKPNVLSVKKKGIIYGEPIDFRGLRYAPVNEQGVVYLFGMISRELGFLIESIRTDFPDCEGKRCLNPEGTKWQHIKIEFEYKSSNFFEHGHDANECDLIVCWIHDWADAPIEVLELKSALNLLSKE
jgi:hypothetical protein